MTRQDYVLIASTIKGLRYDLTGSTQEGRNALDSVSADLCIAFERENSRFDVSKFLSACEYGKLPRASEVA